MGHKVHPKAHRMQVIYTWDSKWFGKNNYAELAQQDIKIREFLTTKFKDAHIDAIGLERSPKNVKVTIFAAKPGFIIGRGGKALDDLRKEIERKFLKMSIRVKLNIKEVRNPALSAAVIAQTCAADIEKRIPFRRIIKQSIERVMKAGAKGVKIGMAGRLNGVEIARSEKLQAGTVPLITMRSDVDYAFVEANTIYGKIGVKVWVCHGEVFGRKDKFADSDEEEKSPKKESFKRESHVARPQGRGDKKK